MNPPTPAFVIDVPALDDFVSRFQTALHAYWPNSILSYSFKTNSLPWLLSYMKNRDVWAEVVSDSEYELALAVGYGADRIVYNGPVKGRQRLRSALCQGSLVNIDSKREVRWACELAMERPDLDLAVGLRVNWDLGKRCSSESTTGGAESRFGFNAENGELGDAISDLAEVGVRTAGLHMHRNSRTQSLDVFRAAAAVAAELINMFGLELDWLDIGGGFFGSTSASPTFDDYIACIREELNGVVNPDQTQLIVEPGGALIAVPVEFHSQVLDVKDAGPNRFVVTDASRTDIDPLFRRSRRFEVRVDSESEEILPEQTICGFTCMEDDRLVHLRDAPELVEGDRIVFYKIGAYTMSYQSSFIEFPPAVFTRNGDSLTEVRRKWEVDDVLQGTLWDNPACS